MTTVLGLDTSLNSSGIAYLHHTDIWTVQTTTVRSKAGADPRCLPDRLRRVHEQWEGIRDWLGTSVDLVVIEAPSLNSRGGKPHERAGIWWRVVLHCHLANIPLVELAPRLRAKYPTGDVRADKQAVAAGVHGMWREQWQPESGRSDESDALALASAGAHALGALVPYVCTDWQTEIAGKLDAQIQANRQI